MKFCKIEKFSNPVIFFNFLFKFPGYTYPRPLKNTLEPTNQSENTGRPPGVQGDFIDDLITEHKQQILSSILSETLKKDSSVAAGDGEYFVISKCASCSKFLETKKQNFIKSNNIAKCLPLNSLWCSQCQSHCWRYQSTHQQIPLDSPNAS